jgi:hypothetical protein
MIIFKYLSMKQLYIILLFFCFAKAEGVINERVIVHTDKDCYFAGEDIYVKMLVINPLFQISDLSRVGYVEICDTEKPYIQLKLAIENGKGYGKIAVPDNIPSGIYQLCGYTRFMRNEGEQSFFKSRIAIINSIRRSEKDRIEILDKPTALITDDVPIANSLKINTDRTLYKNRTQVELSLEEIPDDVIDMTVSVFRNDSLSAIPSFDMQQTIDRMRNFSPLNSSPDWLPEIEGHIINGKIIPNTAPNVSVIPNISVIGKDIQYINGRKNPSDSIVTFYTSGVYNHKQLVSSIVNSFLEPLPNRLDIISPFCEYLPDSLPVFATCLSNNQVNERSVAAQLNTMFKDSVDFQPDIKPYFKLNKPLTYNLDEYTRFSTINETIFEFIYQLKVSKVKGKRIIQIYNPEEQAFNRGNSLILLDGAPVYDHEKLLAYSPYLIHKIDIYSGWCSFSGEAYCGIVAFTTFTGNLPSFRLGSESQLFEYDCPALPTPALFPEYPTTAAKNNRQPDFRHTMYWNPTVENLINNKRAQLSFYTSDLNGDYTAKVECITSSGKYITATCKFTVAF